MDFLECITSVGIALTTSGISFFNCMFIFRHLLQHRDLAQGLKYILTTADHFFWPDISPHGLLCIHVPTFYVRKACQLPSVASSVAAHLV